MKTDKKSHDCFRKIKILRDSVNRIYFLMDFGTENLDKNMISDFCLQISYASKSLKWINDFFPSLGQFHPDGETAFRQLCVSSWNLGRDMVSDPEKAGIPELNLFISTFLPEIDVMVDRFTDERIREVEGTVYNVKEASKFMEGFFSQMTAAKNIVSEDKEFLNNKYSGIEKYVGTIPGQQPVSISFFFLDHALRIAGESLINLSRVAPPVVEGIRVRDAKSVKFYRHLSSHLDSKLSMTEALSRFPSFLEAEKILKTVLDKYPRLKYASDMDREPFRIELTFDDEKYKDGHNADIQERSENRSGHEHEDIPAGTATSDPRGNPEIIKPGNLQL